MRVLDLFSGLRGWSKPFADRGHTITTVDIDPEFAPTIRADVMDLPGSRPGPAPRHLDGYFHVVLASPPCDRFSVASLYRHWDKETRLPKDWGTFQALLLVHHTLMLIRDLDPMFWVLENPRAMLRKVPFMSRYERKTVSLCQYGAERMKPTDLWGVFPPGFEARYCGKRSPCHVSAPRGSSTGTQGPRTAPEKARLPYGLGRELCLAIEKEGVL